MAQPGSKTKQSALTEKTPLLESIKPPYHPLPNSMTSLAVYKKMLYIVQLSKIQIPSETRALMTSFTSLVP